MEKRGQINQREMFPDNNWEALYSILKINQELGIDTPESIKKRYRDIYPEVLAQFQEDFKNQTIH